MNQGRDRGSSLLSENKVHAFWISKRENVRYLSGFTGSSGSVLITREGRYFITDSRYATQSRGEVRGFSSRILRQKELMPDRIADLASKQKVTRLGFEPGDLRVQSYRDLKRRLPSVRLVPVKKGVETLRIIKSEGEIREIEESVRRAETAFQAVSGHIHGGVREQEIAVLMEQSMRRAGSSRPAFDVIVASGERSAMPHGIASEKRLKNGDLVVVDFGAESNAYFSDMTRTLYLGCRLTGTKRKIYETVREAQEAAINAIRPGVTMQEIDAYARKTIRRAGFGRYFGHGTGHGIGLEVHELPRVAPSSRAIAHPGMVFTVEPGIYIPGLGGVRIEDMVLVTEEGCRVLTRLPKGWQPSVGR